MSVIIDKHLEEIGKDRSFLDPSLDEELGISLLGLKESIDLIKEHMSKDSKILIYSDSDNDGITSALILDLMFRTLNYDNFAVLLNERVYGNGINNNTIATIDLQRPNLIITSDHGSSDNDKIKIIRDWNIDIIVTDHHTLKDNVPPTYANAFINPQQEVDDKYKCLSGGGVAYVLANQMIKGLDNSEQYRSNMLEFLALSTIGDMMDMTNEINRHICKLGITELNQSVLGKAYRRLLKYPKQIDSEDIAFTIVPMVNSCARMDSATYAYISLLPPKLKSKHINNVTIATDSKYSGARQYESNPSQTIVLNLDEEEQISTVLQRLDNMKDINNRRKEFQSNLLKDVSGQVRDNTRSNVIIMTRGGGVNGIIASQIGEQTKKPTVVLVHNKNHSTASARGILPDFNVKDCFSWIDQQDEGIFIKYGGHKGAGGCSIVNEKLDDFKRLFEQYTIENTEEYKEDLTDIVSKAIDITRLDNLLEEINSIKQLEPFGNHFRSPTLKVRFDTIKKIVRIPLANDNVLIKFNGVLGDNTFPCVYFGNRNKDIEIMDKDLIFTVSFSKNITFKIKYIL